MKYFITSPPQRIFELFLLSTACLTGCAHYQYNIVEPPEFAQAIQRKGDVTVQRPPLEYNFADLGRSLGVKITNVTDNPILIQGENSYLVDPNGATHPLRSGTIAPHSYVAFPMPPIYSVYRPGPRVGFGFGYGTGGSFIGTGFGSTWADYPAGYYDVVDFVAPWDWGTGEVRLHLSYRAVEQVQQEFLFRRQRVD